MVDSYFEDRDLTMQMHKAHVSSKAKCFWKDCTNRIDPEKMFCSKSCHNKSYSWGEWSRMHRTALKYWDADPAYLAACLVDAGLWHTRMNPVLAKMRKHALWWNESWGIMFSRYGVKKPVPPVPRLVNAVDAVAGSEFTRGHISSSGLQTWTDRHASVFRGYVPPRPPRNPGMPAPPRFK